MVYHGLVKTLNNGISSVVKFTSFVLQQVFVIYYTCIQKETDILEEVNYSSQ